MKLRLLLALLLAGLFCDCGSGGQGGQTAAPNSSHRTGPPPIAAHAAAHRRWIKAAFIFARADLVSVHAIALSHLHATA